MLAISSPVNRFLAGRMRAAMSRHPTYADWIAEIPEPMFKQLVREGLVHMAVYGLTCQLMVCVGYYVLPIWEGKPADNGQAVIWTLLLIFALCFGWRTVAGRCIERECVYRRVHGKWRWER